MRLVNPNPRNLHQSKNEWKGIYRRARSHSGRTGRLVDNRAKRREQRRNGTR